MVLIVLKVVFGVFGVLAVGLEVVVLGFRVVVGFAVEVVGFGVVVGFTVVVSGFGVVIATFVDVVVVVVG